MDILVRELHKESKLIFDTVRNYVLKQRCISVNNRNSIRTSKPYSVEQSLIIDRALAEVVQAKYNIIWDKNKDYGIIIKFKGYISYEIVLIEYILNTYINFPQYSKKIRLPF